MWWWFLGAAFLLPAAVKINKEWEESVVFRLGRLSRKKQRGLYFTIPLIENVIKRDLRVRTLDIVKQTAITKDNISVNIDAVVFMKVIDTTKSIIEVQDFSMLVRQKSQTTFRNVIGKYDLDDLLTKRGKIAEEIRKAVDEATDKWGIDIQNLELQNIELPENMKRVMARQAEAERERRAVVIKAKGEMEASSDLVRASKELEKSKYGFELRKLATISDVSQDQSNTILFALPMEMMKSDMYGKAVIGKLKSK